MKFTADTNANTLDIDGRTVPLFSDAGFEALSELWKKVGWNQKHVYSFSWLGRPLIQLPEDALRIQEVIYALKPDVILETGVAHGGSLIFYASLCKAMGKGRIIGIDIEIRAHNRAAIEAHELFKDYITLIEGSSTAPDIVARAKGLIKPEETVLVILDSDHSYKHVMDELNAYQDLVKKGFYIIATDGSMEQLTDVPRGKADWQNDNPAKAARDFAAKNPRFVIEQPAWPFNESTLKRNITHWPDAWLKCID